MRYSKVFIFFSYILAECSWN